MSELNITWSTEDEIQLFHALEGMKPVGICKHFVMGAIGDRLEDRLGKIVPREEIWKHLRTIYNLDLLDEREPIPFPNKDQEFQLPDEFKSLISNRIQNTNSSEEGEEQNDSKNLNSSVSEPEKKTEQGMNNGNINSGATTKGNDSLFPSCNMWEFFLYLFAGFCFFCVLMIVEGQEGSGFLLFLFFCA